MAKRPKAKPAEAKPLDISLLADATLPGMLTDIVATHIPKVGHSKVPPEQFVRAMKTVKRDHTLTIGICSATIESIYPLGAICAGAKVARSMALSTGISSEVPISALGALVSGDNTIGLDQNSWNSLKESYDHLDDRAPSTITQYERVAYFEDQNSEILVTPLSSVKFIHEMNHRLEERRSAGKEVDKSKKRSLKRVILPIGGANPQNVGYIVNKMAVNTRRGGVPLLGVVCPKDHRGGPQKIMAILRGSQSYDRIAQADLESLLEFGRRSIIDIDLAVHRAAEYRQALEIARHYLSAKTMVAPLISAIAPEAAAARFASMNRHELWWLDPRLGRFDRSTLGRRFADALKQRIDQAMARSRRHDGGGVVSLGLTDRSHAALCAALEECLS